ncbi:EF-1 guanine nucleotide exchange domain protein [Necator americanus]|nr:EF-1 guanine nucleotide exchange domain protein [Necator americanus]ETN86374.1 EF-1 guanine nucleotide exchange domain protein [Necator americanus]
MVDVKSPAGLAAFNETLSTQAFATGFVLSGEDSTLFETLGSAPCAKTYPHVARWYKNIASYDKSERNSWPSAGGSASGDDAKEEDLDLFGSDDEEDAEKQKIVQERLKAYAEKKAAKPGPIAKSSVILDVKPWDDETNLEEMESLVRGIEMDGLVWGGSKLIPVGYGIKKLQIICVIEDLKVSVDDLIDKITGDFEDHVQSVDIVAFNKI